MWNLCTGKVEILPQEFGEPHPELAQATYVTHRHRNTGCQQEILHALNEQQLIIICAGFHGD